MEARNSDNKNSGEHVLELLSAFVDGETSMDETRHVERHVAVCSLCAGQLAFLRATARTLRQAVPVYPSPDLFARIARATYQKPTFGQRVTAFLRPAPVRVALGGALAAGIAAVVVLPGRLTGVPTAPQTGGLASAPPAPHNGKNSTAVASKPVASFKTPSLAVTPNVAKIKAVSAPTHSLGSRPAANAAQPVVAMASPKLTTSEKNVSKFVVPAPAHPAVSVPVLTAARLHVSRNPVQLAMNSDLASRLRNDISSRSSLPSARLVRPDAKIEAGSTAAAANVAPVAVRPEAKNSDLVLNPTPKSGGAAEETAAAAAAPRFSRFNLGGAGTNDKRQNGFITVANRETTSSGGLDGHLNIVQAPIGNDGK